LKSAQPHILLMLVSSLVIVLLIFNVFLQYLKLLF
jgi:hypothetical protein